MEEDCSKRKEADGLLRGVASAVLWVEGDRLRRAEYQSGKIAQTVKSISFSIGRGAAAAGGGRFCFREQQEGTRLAGWREGSELRATTVCIPSTSDLEL